MFFSIESGSSGSSGSSGESSAYSSAQPSSSGYSSNSLPASASQLPRKSCLKWRNYNSATPDNCSNVSESCSSTLRSCSSTLGSCSRTPRSCSSTPRSCSSPPRSCSGSVPCRKCGRNCEKCVNKCAKCAKYIVHRSNNRINRPDISNSCNESKNNRWTCSPDYKDVEEDELEEPEDSRYCSREPCCKNMRRSRHATCEFMSNLRQDEYSSNTWLSDYTSNARLTDYSFDQVYYSSNYRSYSSIHSDTFR